MADYVMLMVYTDWPQLAPLIALGITVAACAIFYRRVRSRAALMMLVGSGGSVLNSLVSIVVFWQLQFSLLTPSEGSFAEMSAVQRFFTTWGTTVIGFFFSLVFAIALLFVLHDAANRYANASHGEGLPARDRSTEDPPDKRIEQTG